MGKRVAIAGIAFIAAILFVQPAKADNFNTYQLTGSGINISFTLPQTLTPSSVTPDGILNFNNVLGTFNGNTYPFATVEIGTAGFGGVTNYYASGSQTNFVAFFAPGLFVWNADGTVTLNTGVYALGDYHLFYGGTSHDFTLTIVGTPGATSVPEPASLALVGVGGLALALFRRRKAA